jgi:hypothetical protein
MTHSYLQGLTIYFLNYKDKDVPVQVKKAYRGMTSTAEHVLNLSTR